MKYICKLACCCLPLMIVGCSATTSDTPVEVKSQDPATKSMLEDIAKSGQIGSDAMTIEESLLKMKNSGDAKADELLKDFAELKNLQGPALKAKATEMAKKL